MNKKIEDKLNQLKVLLNKTDEARIIDSDNPDTWDSDTLYDLVEVLKKALALLEDEKSPKELDDFGNPLILQLGLCSLVDEYQSKKEEDDE